MVKKKVSPNVNISDKKVPYTELKPLWRIPFNDETEYANAHFANVSRN